MGEIRIDLPDKVHAKLKILCAVHNKTYSEIISQLIKWAPVPKLEWGAKVVGGKGVKSEKARVEPDRIKHEFGFREVGD